MAGQLIGGRSVVALGDSAIVAERTFGSGLVTVVGIDPTAGWPATSEATPSLWRRLLPPRSGTTSLSFVDDNLLVSAVSQLPSLALPPIGGLLLLLAGYIALVGPLNYLILRRLDRREWAWITIPVCIVVFAVAAYGYGALLKGTDVIVNEVAIVRAAPGTTEATAQVYLGVFSPTRGRYQLEVGGGALLATPINGELFGATAGRLDVVQGDPSRVRDLDVGFGTLRTIRAEAGTSAPLIEVDVEYVDGTLRGRVRNASAIDLEDVAVVLGRTVAVIGDLRAGQEREVSAPGTINVFDSLSNRILGQVFYDGSGRLDEDQLRSQVRHSMIDQLTYDPAFGSLGGLPAETAVVLAFIGDTPLLDVAIEGARPRRTGNTLFYVPAPVDIRGKTVFAADQLRSTVVDQDAMFFNKGPDYIGLGPGSVTIAYRPIAFEGTISPIKLELALNWGPEFPSGEAKLVAPLSEPPALCTDITNTLPEGCQPRVQDGMPEIELYDLAAEAWVRFPHLATGTAYEVEDPSRYLDPATGQFIVRFVNPAPEGETGFSFALRLTGDIR
jgi:hypothetical protein